MVTIDYGKYETIFIPMQNEEYCNMFEDRAKGTWAFTKDAKKHGRIPPIVLPGLEDIWGGEDYIRSKGYAPHWQVFHDYVTNRYTFGNYRSFIESPDIKDRKLAETFLEVDIEELMGL